MLPQATTPSLSDLCSEIETFDASGGEIFDDHIGGNSRTDLPHCPICDSPATPQVGAFGSGSKGKRRWYECMRCLSNITGKNYQWSENSEEMQTRLRLMGKTDLRQCQERFPRNLIEAYKCSRCGLPAKGHKCLNPKASKRKIEVTTSVSSNVTSNINDATNATSLSLPFSSETFEQNDLELHVRGNHSLSAPLTGKEAEILFENNTSFTCCFKPNNNVDEWFLSTDTMRAKRAGFSSHNSTGILHKSRVPPTSASFWFHGNLCDCAYKHDHDEIRYMCCVCKTCSTHMISTVACSICLHTLGERQSILCKKNCGEKNHVHICNACFTNEDIKYFECVKCGKHVHKGCTKHYPKFYLDSDADFKCQVCICTDMYSLMQGTYDVCNGKQPFDSNSFQSSLVLGKNSLQTMTLYKDVIQTFSSQQEAVQFAKDNNYFAITFQPYVTQCLKSMFAL